MKKASELDYFAKQEILNKLSDSIGYSEFQKLIILYGEDGIIDSFLAEAEKQILKQEQNNLAVKNRIKIFAGFFIVLLIAGFIFGYYMKEFWYGKVIFGLVAIPLFIYFWRNNLLTDDTTLIFAIGCAVGSPFALIYGIYQLIAGIEIMWPVPFIRWVVVIAAILFIIVLILLRQSRKN